MDILALLAVLVLIYMMITFVFIPRNHVVCVEVNGGLLRFMAHSDDKQKISDAFDALPAFVNKSDKRWSDIKSDIDGIVTRDNTGFFIAQWLARWFNIHFKSWNPLATLRKIKVVKTRINSKYNPADPNEQKRALSNMISYDKDDHSEEETPYLRIDILRVMYLHDLELANNTQIRLVMSAKNLRVYDLRHIFYVNPEISTWIELQLSQAASNYFGRFSYEQFQKANLTAEPGNDLNQFFKDQNTDPKKGNSGIYTSGILLMGEISVAQFELSESQRDLAKEKVKLAAAKTVLKRQKLEAEGEAVLVEKPGLARATVMRKQTEAMGTLPSVHRVFEAEVKANGNITTLVEAGGNAMVAIPANQPAPQEPQQGGQQHRGAQQQRGGQNAPTQQAPGAAAQPAATPAASAATPATPPATPAASGTTPTTTT